MEKGGNGIAQVDHHVQRALGIRAASYDHGVSMITGVVAGVLRVHGVWHEAFGAERPEQIVHLMRRESGPRMYEDAMTALPGFFDDPACHPGNIGNAGCTEYIEIHARQLIMAFSGWFFFICMHRNRCQSLQQFDIMWNQPSSEVMGVKRGIRFGVPIFDISSVG